MKHYVLIGWFSAEATYYRSYDELKNFEIKFLAGLASPRRLIQASIQSKTENMQIKKIMTRM
jgi:hypothetical protein